MEAQSRKQYPSEFHSEDPRRLETQIRVFKRWLNSLLKQANAREVIDILDIFRDTKNLYFLCKHLAGQRLMSFKETTPEDASYLDKAVALVERLYGSEIATVIQTAVQEISAKQAWDCESHLRDTSLESSSLIHNLLSLALDAIWIFIVAVRAGTGPASNLGGSISSSGSTITRRSWTGTPSGQVQAPPSLISLRTPCLDRWLIAQDERLMAWCIAVTEGYNGISICNFTNSWRDGLAFLAIAHQSRPDLFTYETRLEKTVNQNLSLAFHLATAEFATPRLLEPMDMHPDSVDARATAAYLMEFRKAVERDRKRRSRGILEIQTSAMTQDQSENNADGTGINVTVLSRSSPTSSASASETTWLDEEEFDEDSGDEAGKPSLPDPEMFDSLIETTLAWLLAMEERFANNDLTKHEASLQLMDRFQWSDYCKTDVRKNLHTLSHLTSEERSEVELLTTLTSESLKKLHGKILARVDEAMAHFEVHEDLTAHLSRRQMSVGRCLRLGSRIIQTCRDRSQLEQVSKPDDTEALTDLDREDQNRIRERLITMDPEVIQRQTALLATRWNNLCRINQTLGRRITACLLRRQGMLLIAIRLQLEKLEAEQTRQAELPFGPSIRELKSQLEVNRNLEEGIEIGEVLAERLDNFITLVPLRGADEDTKKETGLEAIIAELATRWSRLVDWVNTRYAKLQNALLHWRHFEEEASVLSDWLTERAEEVSRVTAMASAAHAKSAAHRNSHERELTSTESSNKSLDRLSASRSGMRDVDPNQNAPSGDQAMRDEKVQRLLDENEAEMEAVDACLAMHESRWAQLLASLDRRAQSLRESCGDTEEVSRLVEATVDQLVSRWSQLAEPQLSTDEWIDRYTRDMDGYVAANRREDMEIEPAGSGKEPELSEHKRTADEQLHTSKASKMPCLDSPPPASPTGYRAEFESKAEELLNWLENSAEILELITMDKNRALEAKNQAQAAGRKFVDLDVHAGNAVDETDRVAKEAVEWRENMNRVLEMGKRYHDELQQAGESVEELDQLFEEVEERWVYLDTLLEEAKRQVRVANRSAEFQQEAAKIQELLIKSQEKDPESGPMDTDLQTVEKIVPVAATPSAQAVTPKQSVEESTEFSNLNRTMEQLSNQLATVEDELTRVVTFSNPDDLDDQLTNMKGLIKDLYDENEKLSALINRTKNMTNFSAYKTRVEEIRSRLETDCNKLKKRQRLLQDLNDQLEFFMNQFEGIEKWLSDMRDYLDSVSQAHLPSTTVIRAQLQESCEALKDMETLEPTLVKVDDVAGHLANYCTPEYKQILNERLNGLRADWAQVRELTKANRDQLEQSLAEKLTTQGTGDTESADIQRGSNVDIHTPQSTSLPDMTMAVGPSIFVIGSSMDAKNNITESGSSVSQSASNKHRLSSSVGIEPPMLRVDLNQLEVWMAEAKRKLAEFQVITSHSELKQLEQTIQDLSEEIAQRRYILAALDTQVAVSMLDQPISETESLLTKAHFADLESAVAAERERVRAARYHLEDFKTVLSGEKRWFGAISELITRIRSSEYGDLSELSDDLESLERVTSEHTKEDEERLESLASSLAASKVLANSVNDDLKEYKQKLSETNSEIDSIKSKNKLILTQCQAAEARGEELISWLIAVEPLIRNRLASSTTTVDAPDKFIEWEKKMNEVDQFMLRIETQFTEAKNDEFSKLLVHKLQLIRNRLQEKFAVVKPLILRLAKPKDFEPRMAKVQRIVSSVENQISLLEIGSLNPDHIQTNTEKAKELLIQLNEIKPDIDYIQQTGQILVENKAVEFPDRLLTDLSMLTERQKKLVVNVLLSLEQLEDLLPLTQRLSRLTTNLNQQLNGVEEVTDYLENTDCPESRLDMLRRVYTSLQDLCGKDGAVEQITETVEKLKALVQPISTKLSAAFLEIEERLDRVFATKQAFRIQLEQAQQALSEASVYEANVVVQPTKTASELKAKPGVKPSVNETIELLINSDASVSPTVRELAREIRDHLRSVVLFNRFCLGTSAPLPSSDGSAEGGGKSHLLSDSQYETTLAERKAMVKYFRQQRTHLGDRLRELIVNAGGGDGGDRLRDLLQLQTVWHETNDKLDRRGEHMALLEQQLTTVEKAIGDYMKNPTEVQSDHCTELLKRLEETYGWKLTADHERIQRHLRGHPATTEPPVSHDTQEGWTFDQNLLSKYEHDLKTVTRLLNEIQLNLDECKCGPLEGLTGLLERLENQFSESYKLLSTAAETLNELTLGSSQPQLSTKTEATGQQGTKSNELNTEELIWLKVLLDTQKNRIDTYSSEFKNNWEYWHACAEQWYKFCKELDVLKNSISRILVTEKELKAGPNPDFREQLRLACHQCDSLNRLGSNLIQASSERSRRLESGTTSTVHSATTESGTQQTSTSSDPTCPPAVPPRKNSLHRGRSLISGEYERNSILAELNNVRTALNDLCRRHRFSEWTIDSTDPGQFDAHDSLASAEEVPVRESNQQSYVNVDWLDDGAPPIVPSAFESLGSYRNDVEACLRGLMEENRWFSEESGLVPASLLKRKSDDILLASAANRTKPTSPAELRLDNRFWLAPVALRDSQEPKGTIECTASWLKSKWAELEALIETTVDHEKQSNNWCRKATQLVKVLRERSGRQMNGTPDQRILTRLDLGCANLREALKHAQQALERRKACLTRWQSYLVELDVMLEETQAIISSLEMSGVEIRAQTPSAWLAELYRRVQDVSREGNTKFSREQWMTELNPRNAGLGSHLEKLAIRWNFIQGDMAASEQSSLVRIPNQLAIQVRTLLGEWDKLKKLFNFKSIKGWSVEEQNGKVETHAPSAVTATVICAPNSWSAHTSSEPLSTAAPAARKSVSKGPLTQATSPTLARIRQEIDQLSRWLTSIIHFIENSRVRLGDRFDQETANRQLQQANLATREGSQMNLQQVYHPAALQLKIQQLLTELEARKPQLDRINIEKERLVVWGSDETLEGDIASQAESLPHLWTTAERQLTQRSTELEDMLNDTQRLKELEREVDHWINKAESELSVIGFARDTDMDGSAQSSRRFASGPDANIRKRLQDLSDNVAGRVRETWEQYRTDCEALIKRCNMEDNSKLQADLDHLSKRWNELQERLIQANQSITTATESRFGSPGPDTDRKHRRTPNLERSPREGLIDRLEQMERRLNQIGLLASEWLRQVSAMNDNTAVVEHRGPIMTELQALQSELNTLSTQIGGSTRPSNHDLSATADGELLHRVRQLEEKVVSVRQSVQTSPNQHSLFLVRLKQLNSWVSHRDAAFQAIRCPLHGDRLFIMKMRELILNLFRDLEIQRTQVEEALHQGQIQYGEERVDANLESEVESDGSELGLRSSTGKVDTAGQGNVTDEQTKRVIRRIRRYLYHLKKRWSALNSNMLSYKQQLDSIYERLTNFRSLFDDAVEQVRNAHMVTMRWTPVENIDVNHLEAELEHTQSFHNACEPLIALLDNLDRHLVHFRDSSITIDPVLIAQQAALRNDFDQVRLFTESRIHAINQALASIQIQAQHNPPLTRIPSNRRTPTAHVRTPVHDGTQASAAISPATVEPFVPLNDSVSPPWERCVHPSGTRVPYYKNHSTQETQWDHPILAKLMQSMKQLNGIRFAEYRTAVKLRHLQKTLCLDALSISIIAESLKLIGHSQPIDGPHTDPFDRTINVPQIEDCLLQLYERANAAYGQPGAHETLQQQKQAELSDFDPQKGFDDPLNPGYSPRKTPPNSRYSTLPAGSKPSDIRNYDPPRGRSSITKCGRGFRRSASAQRASRRTPTSANQYGSGPNTHPILSIQGEPALTEGNRSASLPESVQLAANACSSRGSAKRGANKLKRGFPTGPTQYPVNVCVDLTLNWLLNVYDRMRKGNIRALSFKVALTVLSVANLDDKYRYLFSLIADSNGCVTEQRLSALLYECILIPRNLGEGGWIGKEDFETTVKLCFNQVLEIARSSDRHQSSSPYRSQSIPVRHFLTWLRFGPQTIAWLPLLHRVMLAEQMVHPIRCGVCQTHPVVGLRYRCLRCLNFDLCQQCFFSGRTARSHKLTHPMQEYCSNSTSSDSFRDFTRIVRNRFRSRDRLQQANTPHSVLGRPTLQPIGLSRGRSRCCEPVMFSEDKPRPAPKFGSDLASLLPRDTTIESSGGWRDALKNNSIESTEPAFMQTQTPNILESTPGRPISSNLQMTTPEHGRTPRTVSDTRQQAINYREPHVNDEASHQRERERTPINSARGSVPLADDEHHLIAEYSRELRQQSEPELTPRQMTHPAHASTIPGLMDRSTISDGLPSFPNHMEGDPRTGHLSLDRRQLSRTTPSQPVPHNGYSSGPLDPTTGYGRFSGLNTVATSQMDTHPSYRPTPQPGCYPLASNPAIHRDFGYDLYGANNIQRSYSMRARSQPPPDAHWQSLRQTPNAQLGMRSNWYPSNVSSSQAGYPQSALQTIQSLEEERTAMLYEYDKLRQRSFTPATSYTASSRIHAQPAQQRFARMQPQHYQQQQELLRATPSRGYNQRMPLQRPPSAGQVQPNIVSVPGRFTYGGSLGRANSVTNDFNYFGEVYGSEPRVGAPYGTENFGLAGPDFQTGSVVTPGDIAATEARVLREHKGRLEVRMQQLEDQNRQLEQQLQRLRQYVVGGASNTTPTGTLVLPSDSKVSTDLLLDPKTVRQRSASGGLAGKYNNGDGKPLTGSGSVGQLANPSHPDNKSTGVGQEGNYQRPATSNSTRMNQHDYYQPHTEELFEGTENNQPEQHLFSGVARVNVKRYN